MQSVSALLQFLRTSLLPIHDDQDINNYQTFTFENINAFNLGIGLSNKVINNQDGLASLKFSLRRTHNFAPFSFFLTQPEFRKGSAGDRMSRRKRFRKRVTGIWQPNYYIKP